LPKPHDSLSSVLLTMLFRGLFETGIADRVIVPASVPGRRWDRRDDRSLSPTSPTCAAKSPSVRQPRTALLARSDSQSQPGQPASVQISTFSKAPTLGAGILHPRSSSRL